MRRPRSLRSWLYLLARILGDINAIRRGPTAMVKRGANKVIGRALGRLFLR
jgi:hypothetical protein